MASFSPRREAVSLPLTRFRNAATVTGTVPTAAEMRQTEPPRSGERKTPESLEPSTPGREGRWEPRLRPQIAATSLTTFCKRLRVSMYLVK